MYIFRSRFTFGVVLNHYESLVSSNQIKRDPTQIETIRQFDRLHEDLLKLHPQWLNYQKQLHRTTLTKEQTPKEQPYQKQSLFSSLFKTSPPPPKKQTHSPLQNLPKVRGLYLYGSPGCGKTFLMNTFYDAVEISEKQRIHFNEFMLSVHKDIHKLHGERDQLSIIAQNRAKKTRLLCLDEFQVTDIGDALILKSLFEKLIQHQVVLMSTSNRPPDDLYKNGLQRHIFLPFIPFLKEQCVIYNIDSSIDYRYEGKSIDEKIQTYVVGVDDKSSLRMDKMFQKLARSEKIEEKVIEVIQGRNYRIRRQQNGVCLFEFQELSDDFLGAADFIAICRNFHSIVLKNVQMISMNDRNTARRFILFIDEVYNHHVKLYMNAPTDLMNLFVVKREAEAYDEEFALERCRSRLHEIQTKEYQAEPSYFERT